MKSSEIKEMSQKELVERLENEKDVYTRLVLNHTVSPLDNPMKIRHTRRNIARLITEFKKRQLAESPKR